MGFIWGRQDPGGPHVGPMDFAYLGAATCKQSGMAWRGLTCHTYSKNDMLQNLEIYLRDLNFLRYPTHHETRKKRVTEAWISNCISQITIGDTCFWHQSPHVLLIFSCFDMPFCTRQHLRNKDITDQLTLRRLFNWHNANETAII